MTPITHATSPAPQFNLDGFNSPRGKRFNTAADLEAHLATWVEATPARIPFELREQAAETIRLCWLEKGASLNLAGMQLSTLPEAVFEMDHLRLLNLSGNQLTELPDTVHGLTGLKTLNLSLNPLRRLPEVLPDLEGLMLIGARLEKYPRHLFDLPVDCMIYLRDVSLNNYEEAWLANQRAAHPNGPNVDRVGPPRRNPGSATNLDRTSSDNEAQAPASTVIGFNWDSPNSAFTPTIGRTNPGAAPAMATPATSAPMDIGHPSRQRDSNTKLEALWRKHWGDTAEEKTDSPIVRRSRADTRLAGYGVDMGLRLELRAWIHSVSDPAIQDKRRSAARMIQICIDREGTNLNLGNLDLTDLPEILWAQNQITQLHLGGNQLGAEVLADISKLKNLTHLLLPSNGLSRLPPQVATLSKLRVLDLSNNCFVGAPPQIAGLSRLEFLYLNNNPIWHRRGPTAVPAACQVTY